jgi:hypothetical protein
MGYGHRAMGIGLWAILTTLENRYTLSFPERALPMFAKLVETGFFARFVISCPVDYPNKNGL